LNGICSRGIYALALLDQIQDEDDAEDDAQKDRGHHFRLSVRRHIPIFFPTVLRMNFEYFTLFSFVFCVEEAEKISEQFKVKLTSERI
jgi:hypothetical protein